MYEPMLDMPSEKRPKSVRGYMIKGAAIAGILFATAYLGDKYNIGHRTVDRVLCSDKKPAEGMYNNIGGLLLEKEINEQGQLEAYLYDSDNELRKPVEKGMHVGCDVLSQLPDKIREAVEKTSNKTKKVADDTQELLDFLETTNKELRDRLGPLFYKLYDIWGGEQAED